MSRWSALASVALVLAIAMSHARPAEADAFFGALVGGFIGAAVGSQPQQRQRVRTTQPRNTQPRRVQPGGAANVQRQANRDLQSALNFFGFNVGAVDGSIGPRSRAGISQYQAYLGFAANGQITDFERAVLITAWNRAQAGGPQVTQVTARHRDGMRGLLEAVRDEMAGGPARQAGGGGAYGLPAEVARGVDEIAASSEPTAEQLVQRAGFIQLADLNGDGRTDYILDTSVTGSAFWCSQDACTVLVYVSTPDGFVRNDFRAHGVTPAMFDCLRGVCDLIHHDMTTMTAAVQPAPAEPAAPALPSFFGSAAAPSIAVASHCNRVALVTSASGGFVTLATLDDPLFALNEQFCLARSYAIAEGETLAAQVQGATPQTIAGQCAALAPLLHEHVGALPLRPPSDVRREVAQFVLGTGMAPTELAATARICLSSGYSTDEMPVVLGSVLLLHALGETGYGELAGHHLLQGFGLPAHEELALAWFSEALPAQSGAVPVGFNPGPAGRPALIRAALSMLENADAPAPAAVPVTTGGASLPLFDLRGAD